MNAGPIDPAAAITTASAHGKVILLGEHVVVGGAAALAAGLARGVELRARPTAPGRGRLVLASWDLDLALGEASEHPVARACAAVARHCGADPSAWLIEGTATLPARAGLGSSASLTVALARLWLGGDGHAPLERCVAASLAGEEVFHGAPSGVDSEVAARGGVLRFVRGQPVQAVEVACPLTLVVLPTEKPRSTATQIERFAARRARLGQAGEALASALGHLTAQGEEALEHGDLERLGALLDAAHGCLAAMDVSCRALDELVGHAREQGALGAKLTGAGGGGCAIALARDDAHGRALERALSTVCPTAFSVQIAATRSGTP